MAGPRRLTALGMSAGLIAVLALAGGPFLHADDTPKAAAKKAAGKAKAKAAAKKAAADGAMPDAREAAAMLRDDKSGPCKKFIFNVRASYGQEARATLEYFTALGVPDDAHLISFDQNDAFGDAAGKQTLRNLVERDPQVHSQQ